MNYDPELHHRRSIRLRGHDYASAHAYFVTICMQDRAPLLGKIIEGTMRLSSGGRTVLDWWQELPRKFPSVDPDAFVIMPNHFHGIIVIRPVGADLCVRPSDMDRSVRQDQTDLDARPRKGAHTGAPLPRVIQWFKTMTTSGYIRGVKLWRWPAFNRRLWQRNYHERIIRDDAELNRIRQYIVENPSNWASDPENPDIGAGAIKCRVRQVPPGLSDVQARSDEGRDESRPCKEPSPGR